MTDEQPEIEEVQYRVPGSGDNPGCILHREVPVVTRTFIVVNANGEAERRTEKVVVEGEI